MTWTRRNWLTAAGASTATGWLGNAALFAGPAPTLVIPATAPSPTLDNPPAVQFSLNTSTIRGHNLPLDKMVELVADAGYHGIEPWIRDIDDFEKAGGKLTDLRKKIDDRGLTVVSAIGFAKWGVNDDQQRQEGLAQLGREMDKVHALGGRRIAAPPSGINGADAPRIELDVLAQRYAAAVQLGTEHGVIPQLEIWGSSRNLSRLPEAMYVAAACGRPEARILPDIYHLYRGGTPYTAVDLLAGSVVEVFHLNDYPAQPPQAELKDSDRVFCGAGVAPVTNVVRSLMKNGFRGFLSLELFNKSYYALPVREVLSLGLASMQTVLTEAQRQT